MKNVTLVQFIDMLQDEYRKQFGQSADLEFVTFLLDVREDRQETLELIMALTKKLNVPVNRGRVRDEFLLPGTRYIIQDIYEEFVRVWDIGIDRNYRYRWGAIGAGVIGLCVYFAFQGMGPQSALAAFAASAIFEQLRGVPRAY